jgi:transposase-like protein
MEPNAKLRRRYTAEERSNYVRLYRQSGLTQQAFAQEHGFHAVTLRKWLKESPEPSRVRRPIFKEFPLSAATPAWSAEIAFGQEVAVRLGAPASAEFIVQLVKSLRGSC